VITVAVVAQSVERQAFNLVVAGSSPADGNFLYRCLLLVRMHAYMHAKEKKIDAWTFRSKIEDKHVFTKGEDQPPLSTGKVWYDNRCKSHAIQRLLIES
jgi:hypothetical protein